MALRRGVTDSTTLLGFYHAADSLAVNPARLPEAQRVRKPRQPVQMLVLLAQQNQRRPAR